MSLLSEYDLRQIFLIKKKIVLFEENNLGLREIIGDLSGLLNVLEHVSASWKDDFQSEINTLEIIHASIEDGSISRWKGDYKKDMHDAISKLKMMAISIIEEYLEKSDVNISETAIKGGPDWLICPNCNDAWKSGSIKAMVICPKCGRVLRNPINK